MNKLLHRQLDKAMGPDASLPEDMIPLFEAISAAYDGFEADRRLIERSLDISSSELRSVNQKLRREIQEREQAEQTQSDLLEQAVKANEELTRFAYVISHDLKTPLRGIATLASWLDTDFGEMLNQDARANIQHLIMRVERMYQLIDDLLEYSRIRSDPQNLAPVNLAELVPDIINKLCLSDAISVTIENPLPEIVFEEQPISQVFIQLLSNAVRFASKADGCIFIRCRDHQSHWQISIADNGPGIPEQHHERVFELFQTLEHWEETQGTGVGLPMVKKIIEMHGGRVWVERDTPKGCTMSFTIPHVACETPKEGFCNIGTVL